jgi:hypothetical protein
MMVLLRIEITTPFLHPTSFCIFSLIGAALSLPVLSSTPAVPIPYPTLSFQPAPPSSPPNSSFIEAPTIPPSSPSILVALSLQFGSPITLTSTYAPVLFGGCTSTPDVCGPHIKINSDHIALRPPFPSISTASSPESSTC